MKPNWLKLIAAVVLIALGSVGRILLMDFPNVETITVVSLLGGALLGGVYILIVPLATVALTDMYIGNDPILLFTWSAWAVIGLLGWLLRRSKKDYAFGLKLTGMGIAASLFFFIWTNFGVWLMWPQMYSHTWSGLVQCYVMALPFLKMSLLGNLIIVPAVSFPLIFILKQASKFSVLPGRKSRFFQKSSSFK